MKRTILVILLMKDDVNSAHFMRLMAEVLPQINEKRPQYVLQHGTVGKFGSQAELIESIQEAARGAQAGLVILVGDWFHNPVMYRSFLKGPDWLGGIRTATVSTLAVARRHGRIADIDRVVQAGCTAGELGPALERITDRLEYMSLPEKIEKPQNWSLRVRPLKNGNVTEFRKYFALRQQIYISMGYLDETAEQCCSQLEINEADTHAIHIGAFVHADGQETLIGTARVVMNTAVNQELRDTFESMVKDDLVVRQKIRDPYQLELPIFQSHSGMNKIMTETLKKRLICGELSRVTVARKYRGFGISRDLITTAVTKAIAGGVERIFLECLEIHEPLYRKHSFNRIEGVKGLVVDVGRTMIAMEMAANAMVQIKSGLPPSNTAGNTNLLYARSTPPSRAGQARL